MAIAPFRTVMEEVTDAVAAIDAARVEMDLWRDNLLRIQDEADKNINIAYQARRNSQIVIGLVRQADSRTGAAIVSAERRLVE